MLDIIIPTYKNQEGLVRTLQSIDRENPEIQVTIIIDCDGLSYKLEPHTAYVRMDYNSGPGCARQRGIDFTKEPYIMFIDTGDYILDKSLFSMILRTIQENPDVDIFSWKHIWEETGNVCKENHNRMHGRVYKRAFLDKYHINFCCNLIASYANEDIGFNRACRMIVKNGNGKILILEQPILMWTSNPNSLTKQNNGEFSFKKQNLGLAINESHAIFIAQCAGVSYEILAD